MPNVADAELLDTLHSLPEESQHSLLKFALFLRHEQEQLQSQEEDAEWEKRFADPEKMTRFAQWAENSLKKGPVESLDFSKL